MFTNLSNNRLESKQRAQGIHFQLIFFCRVLSTKKNSIIMIPYSGLNGSISFLIKHKGCNEKDLCWSTDRITSALYSTTLNLTYSVAIPDEQLQLYLSVYFRGFVHRNDEHSKPSEWKNEKSQIAKFFQPVLDSKIRLENSRHFTLLIISASLLIIGPCFVQTQKVIININGNWR